ncbi:MAG: hypothetical protein MRJ65_06575 [Candidatus Brocadiaceae bacterium]|nr:hypothetical protein [Candidatus Brocadiaceae bacterium]
MGPVYAELLLTNAGDIGLHRSGYIKDSQVRKITISSRVDPDVYLMVIPEHVKLQLGLEQTEQRKIELENGQTVLCGVAEPIEIRFENRRAVANAFVLGDEVLLGAILIGELDVVVNEREQRLTVNPENPTIPRMRMK